MVFLLLICIICMFEFQYSYGDSICQTIDSPGEYIFGSIQAEPTDSDDAVICVQANDVIINFQGNSITQANQVAGLTAIRVSDGVDNVVVKNVEIYGLTGNAIVVQEGCSDITLHNINVENCNAGAILFAGTVSDTIERCSINKCSIATCTGANGGHAYGIRLMSCEDVVIDNCTIQGNDGGMLVPGFGISLELCQSCHITKCRVNENGGNTLGVGISLFQSKWTLIENCTILNTISRSGVTTSKSVGLLLDECMYTFVNKVVTEHNNNLLAEAYGIQALAGNDNVFEQCVVKNSVGGTAAVGFMLGDAESNSSILNCLSRSNNAGVVGEAIGILLDSAQKCDIFFNQVLSNQGLTGIGLKDTVVNTNNLIAGNVSFNNTTTAFDVQRLVGSFPVVSAQVGDFSAITATSKYMNIDFSVGPV